MSYRLCKAGEGVEITSIWGVGGGGCVGCGVRMFVLESYKLVYVNHPSNNKKYKETTCQCIWERRKREREGGVKRKKERRRRKERGED